MEKTQELFEKIDDYLNNRLTGVEKTDFEVLIASNEKLQEEVEKYELIREALADQEAINFRKKLIDIDRKLESQTKQSNLSLPSSAVTSNNNRYWKIAAMLVILLGISSLFFLFPSDQPDLFAQNYIAYPIQDVTRGENQVEEFKTITSLYNNGAYKKAIPLLEEQIENAPVDERMKLYLGNCYLNTDQEKKALFLFTSFKENSPYFYDGQWFTALTYIKSKDFAKAKPILEQLSNSANLYKSKAENILKNIK
ncbi:tol-pal system YbgF family protein [Aquimarina sp. SS2-1]|uniref:tetratricopeptide repeat protein n=1 Tax=Aquimarina besae TaxID=3342247 RepID=UPI0036703C89